jgi:hypothetical protein
VERQWDHAGHVEGHIFKEIVGKKVLVVSRVTRRDILTQGSQEEERRAKEKDGADMEKVGRA